MKAVRLNHFVSIFILLAWAGVLLYFFTSGRVNALLTESFRIGPLLAGLGLLVVALFNLFTSRVEAACCGEVGETDCGHDHDHDHDHKTCCGHDHDHEHHHHHDHEHAGHQHQHHHHEDHTLTSVVITAAIVLVPLFAAATKSEDRLSLDTLSNKGLYSNNNEIPAANAKPKDNGDSNASNRYTLADLEKQVRKSPEGNFMIPIPSLFYSAGDQELADVLVGQAVETTGQVVKELAENDPNSTRLRLYRLFVSCCLADARPLGFSIDFKKTPPKFDDDTWVKVVGKMAYPKDNNDRPVAVLEVDSIEPIPAPEDAMF